MGFIKNVLIGIALYEVANYFLNKKDTRLAPVNAVPLANPAPRTGGQLNRNLQLGADPEAPLGGFEPEISDNDPWKQSLANDELRAPDS